MFPLIFGADDKDNTRYYLMGYFDIGGSQKELLTDDFFKNLEKKDTNNTLQENNSLNRQTITKNGASDKIKNVARGVVEPIMNIVGSRYVKEGLFALNNPLKAVMTGVSTNYAPNISSTVTRFANAGKILGMNSKQLDEVSERGAMRHALWQATLSALFGKTTAQRIGNAHEDGFDYNTDIRRHRTLKNADKVVDLLNNIEGRKIAETYRTLNPKRMALRVLKEFKNNGLYIAVQEADGYWHIERRKLDEEKYNKMLNEFQNMNFWGYR